jgi:Phosphoheptose isomerase
MDAIIETFMQRYPALVICTDEIEKAYMLLETTFRAGGKLLLCGNGGSAADCEHIVGELAKAFRRPRPLPQVIHQQLLANWPDEGEYLAERLQGALPALSLVSQTAFITAITNDIAPDLLFAQQVYAFGRAGDVVMGISTSGRSSNVCQAFRVARALGLHTIGLTGASGGLFPDLCDVAIRVPRQTVTEIQELHLPIYHLLCTLLEENLFA